MNILGRLMAAFKRTDSTGQMARGSLISFCINFCAALCTFGSQVYLARLLGVESFGIYVYILIWLNLIGVGSSLGFENVLLRFLPIYATRNEWSLYAGVRRQGYATALIIAPLLGGLSALGLWFSRDAFSPDLLLSGLLGCLILPIFTLNRLQGICLQAHKYVGRAKIPQMLLHPLLLVGGAALYDHFRIDEWSAHKALCIYLIASSLALVVGSLYLARYLPKEGSTTPPTYRHKEWLSTGIDMVFFAVLVQYSSPQLDMLFLANMRSMAECGIYAASYRLAALTLFGYSASNAIVAPLIGEAHAKSDKDELQRIAYRASVGSTLTWAPVALALVIFGEWALDFSGPTFSIGYPILLLLLGFCLPAVLAGPAPLILQMSGHQRDSIIILILAMILNVGLNLVLIPQMGMTGAAISALGWSAFSSLLMVIAAWRRSGVISTIMPLRLRNLLR